MLDDLQKDSGKTNAEFLREIWNATKLSDADFEEVDDLSDTMEIQNAVVRYIQDCGVAPGLKDLFRTFLMKFTGGGEFRDYVQMLSMCGMESNNEKCRHLATLFSRVLRGELFLEHVIRADAFESVGNNQWQAVWARLKHAELACQQN